MHIIEIARAGVITDAPSISSVGMNVLNFLLQITGIIAILVLVAAGIMYITSNGNERRTETAKRATVYAVLGLVFAMGGMILIKFIGQFFK